MAGKIRTRVVVVCVIAALIVLAVILVVVLTQSKEKTSKKEDRGGSKGAVASDATLCNKVGKNVMKDQGGNAVDAAVATIFCLGVVNLMSLGIGGGGFMVVHDAKKNETKVYDYREVAPKSAYKDMYKENPDGIKYGATAAAVPGQVRGLKLAHTNHGRLNWSLLFNETIEYARDGFAVHKPLAHAISTLENATYNISDGLKSLLQKDGIWLKEGDILKNLKLAKTLEIIRDDPEDFYTGELARKMAKDIQDAGGYITEKDLEDYKPEIRTTLNFTLKNNLAIHTMLTPAGGAPLAMIQNIISGYDFTDNTLATVEEQVKFYQPFIEAMKFGFAQRGLLGDPAFVGRENISRVEDLCTDLSIGEKIRKNKIKMNETHFNVSWYGGSWGEDDFGTSHTSVYLDGSAVSSTNTVNLYFGSKFLSPQTGIILNNQMDDFSIDKSNSYGLPPSSSNFIAPGKRPQSSASPTIIFDGDGKVKMVVGASGGSQIISSVSEVIAKTLYIKGGNLQHAIKSFRIHNQGMPNTTSYYKPGSYVDGVTDAYTIPSNALIKRLGDIGHIIKSTGAGSVTQGILVSNDEKLYAMSDARKAAIADGFNCVVYTATDQKDL